MFRANLNIERIITKQTYSFTNHLNWIYKKKGQKNSNEATNVNLPIKLDNKLKKIFNKIDSIYKRELEKKKYWRYRNCYYQKKKIKKYFV